MKYPMFFGCLTAALCVTAAAAHDSVPNGFNDKEHTIKTVFVIALENNNWEQPNGEATFSTTAGNQQQIFKNPVAPFINSLVSGTAVATINGRSVNISRQTSYATNYRHVLSTVDGNNPHIHPSEPNYFWAEAGTNYNIFDDTDPYVVKSVSTSSGNFVNNQDNQLHLVRALTHVGKTWRSYQEDIDLVTDAATGKLVNTVLPRNQWTVPLRSFSGSFTGNTFNEYYGTAQYNYAAKHNPMVFFTDSNGGNDPTPDNPLAQNYAPLQQLVVDLARDQVADYNWITPNQFNDMHSSLSGGFKGITGQDAARIAQGDNFLSIVIPRIMASRAYQDHGAIIIWTDETEPATSENHDDFTHSLTEIVISPDAHPNVNGLPYASDHYLTHSSDLRTLQEIFHATKPFFIGDAINAEDLSDLFAKGAIPQDDDDDDHGHDGGHGGPGFPGGHF